MTDVELFRFDGEPIRAVLVDGQPWFVAADVCALLGYSRVADALRIPDSDDLGTQIVGGVDGLQRPTQVVNEPGLYALILRSRRQEARAFKRWVTHEVLPAVRRTGQYAPGAAAVVPAQVSRRELALAVIEAEDRADREAASRLAAEEQRDALAPAAESWAHLADASGDYSLRDAAHVLSRSPGVEIGQNRLAELLRELGWIDRRTMRPYQSQVAADRLAARVSMFVDDDGKEHVRYQARIRPKGLHALRAHLEGSLVRSRG